MNENKGFQAILPTGETIIRNNEGGYLSKLAGVDNNFEIVVSPDHVIESLVRNIDEIQKRHEQILQMRYDSYLSLKRETAQRNNELSLQYGAYAGAIYDVAQALGYELKTEGE
ncbi:hypothetical protein AB9M90_10470 [Bacillus safensis]|uniref:hypothetical protein n=1 Tax=Bacillus safensis TaxID=561879 RepID=UPI003515A860